MIELRSYGIQTNGNKYMPVCFTCFEFILWNIKLSNVNYLTDVFTEGDKQPSTQIFFSRVVSISHNVGVDAALGTNPLHRRQYVIWSLFNKRLSPYAGNNTDILDCKLTGTLFWSSTSYYLQRILNTCRRSFGNSALCDVGWLGQQNVCLDGYLVARDSLVHLELE